MAARQPADPAAGVPRLPGWYALFAVWAAVIIGIGVIVVWAEARPPRPLGPVAAPTEPAQPAPDQVTSLTRPEPASPEPADSTAEPPARAEPPTEAPRNAVVQPDPPASSMAPVAPVVAEPVPTAPAAALPAPPAVASVATPPPAAQTASPPATDAAPADTPATPPQIAAVLPPPAPRPETPVQAATGAAPPPPRPDAAVQTAVVVPPPPPPVAVVPPQGSDPPLPMPDPALLEPSRYGMLPRRAPDGRMPYQAYAQPYRRSDYRPRIGLIIADSGAFESYSEDMLRRLPTQVAIAISPYSPYAEAMAARARERGMEVLLGLPLEPAGFPLNDPGHRALLTARSLADNADNLEWALSRFRGYVGVIGALGPMRGERFAQQPDQLRRVHDSLRERGLLYIDPRPGTPTTDRVWGRTVDIVLDEPPTRIEIERRLSELDTIARLRGSAVAYAGTLSPSLVDRLAGWWAGLEARGLLLAPVSSLLRVRQPVEPHADSVPPVQR